MGFSSRLGKLAVVLREEALEHRLRLSVSLGSRQLLGQMMIVESAVLSLGQFYYPLRRLDRKFPLTAAPSITVNDPFGPPFFTRALIRNV